MKNIMIIGGHTAVVAYVPETGMFRGEFVDLNGGAEFYAAGVSGLRNEGELSLEVFLEECSRRNIPSQKQFSGN